MKKKIDLRRAIRANGYSLGYVSGELKLSIPTLSKRLKSPLDFTLSQLETLGTLLKTDVIDLIRKKY